MRQHILVIVKMASTVKIVNVSNFHLLAFASYMRFVTLTKFAIPVLSSLIPSVMVKNFFADLSSIFYSL